MGSLFSYFVYGVDTGRTDDPDPVSGLTSRDRYLIRTSWEIIMKDPTTNGMKLFLKLFDINPKYQEKFPFRKVPYNELTKSRTFQAHCNSVVYAFASMISTLEEPEILISISEKIGISHSKRGVNEQALKDVKEAFMGILTSFSEEHLASWNKFLDVGSKYMLKAINESQN